MATIDVYLRLGKDDEECQHDVKPTLAAEMSQIDRSANSLLRPKTCARSQSCFLPVNVNALKAVLCRHHRACRRQAGPLDIWIHFAMLHSSRKALAQHG